MRALDPLDWDGGKVWMVSLWPRHMICTWLDTTHPMHLWDVLPLDMCTTQGSMLHDEGRTRSHSSLALLALGMVISTMIPAICSFDGMVVVAPCAELDRPACFNRLHPDESQQCS